MCVTSEKHSKSPAIQQRQLEQRHPLREQNDIEETAQHIIESLPEDIAEDLSRFKEDYKYSQEFSPEHAVKTIIEYCLSDLNTWGENEDEAIDPDCALGIESMLSEPILERLSKYTQESPCPAAPSIFQEEGEGEAGAIQESKASDENPLIEFIEKHKVTITSLTLKFFIKAIVKAQSSGFKSLSEENEVKTFAKKIFTAIPKPIIDQAREIQAEVNHNFSGDIFAYNLSLETDLDIEVASSTLGRLTVDKQTQPGLIQRYQKNCIDGFQLLIRSDKVDFIDSLEQKNVIDSLLFIALISDDDKHAGNIFFDQIKNRVVLIDNERCMPLSNQASDLGGDIPFRCWLLAFPVADTKIPVETLQAIVSWEPKKFKRCINKAYKSIHPEKVQAFKQRLNMLQELARNELAKLEADIDVSSSCTAKAFIFKLFPKYQIQWEILEAKGYPPAEIAHRAGRDLTCNLRLLPNYNKKEPFAWHPHFRFYPEVTNPNLATNLE